MNYRLRWRSNNAIPNRVKHRRGAAALSVVLLAAMSTPAIAQVLFERADIRIDPPPAASDEPVAARPARLSYHYNIEVRGEDAFQLEYIHTLNTLTDTTGVAILLSEPAIAGLPNWQVQTPVDALFVAADGRIVQIFPAITLASLQQEIYAKEPIRAVLFLKSGEAALRGIRPRDAIAGSMFTPAPPEIE